MDERSESLDANLRVVRESAVHKMREAEKTFKDRVLEVHEELFDKEEGLFLQHHKVRCRLCDGTGAVERMDSGYMRRFGLREWDGCKACGGEADRRGRGYVARTEEEYD